jgi:LmbE family N-acetylglucosaminyl deacetylase
MLNLLLGDRKRTLKRILCLGAHCDDIEIGCGGTILRILDEHPGTQVQWLVFSSTAVRRKEADKAARLFLQRAQKPQVVIRELKDSFFPYQGPAIKSIFETLKKKYAPDLIFSHYRSDLHQDHRVISDLTWNTFRDHLICEYEIPKYDGDLGAPNFFVGLNDELCSTKIAYLLQSFKSQKGKQWFTEDTFRALLRLRGIECNAPSKFAEAFHCRKLTY